MPAQSPWQVIAAAVHRATGGLDQSGCRLKSMDNDNFQAPNLNCRLSICGLTDGSGGPADCNRSRGLYSQRHK